MNQNGNIPILGQDKPRSGTSVQALVRKLDTDGFFELAGVIQHGENLVSVPHRSDFVDAEELVEMIRQMIRLELAMALAQGAPRPSRQVRRLTAKDQ